MPPTRPFITRGLGNDALLLLGARGVYKLSGLVFLLVLSRVWDATQIGVFYFAVSFAESLIIVATCNLNPVLMRRVASTPERAARHLAAVLGFLALSGPLYIATVTVAALALRPEHCLLIVAVALYKLVERWHAAIAHFFVALGRVFYDVVIGVSVQLLFLAAFLVAMLTAPSLETLIGVQHLRALGLLGAALLLTRLRLFKPRLIWDPSLVRAAPLFVALSLLASMEGKLDNVLLGFLAEYEAVGHYQLALNVLFAALFLPNTIALAIYPRIAAASEQGASRRLLARAALGLGALGALGGGVVFFAAHAISALLYGPLGAEVAPLLRTMALLFPLSFTAHFLLSVLPALRLERVAIATTASGTLLSVAATVALIPLFGAVGVIYARIGAAALQLVLTTVVLARGVDGRREDDRPGP